MRITEIHARSGVLLALSLAMFRGVAAAQGFMGDWELMTKDSYGYESKSVMTLERAGKKLTGSVDHPQYGDLPLVDLKLKERVLSFRIDPSAIEGENVSGELAFKKGGITGEVSTPDGAISITGKKAPVLTGAWNLTRDDGAGIGDAVLTLWKENGVLKGSANDEEYGFFDLNGIRMEDNNLGFSIDASSAGGGILAADITIDGAVMRGTLASNSAVIEVKGAKASPAAGTWKLTGSDGSGTENVVLNLTDKDGKLAGTFATDNYGTHEITGAAFKRGTLTFRIEDQSDASRAMTATLKLKHDLMDGILEGGATSYTLKSR